mgnify:CR=1 FL=1
MCLPTESSLIHTVSEKIIRLLMGNVILPQSEKEDLYEHSY